jgi:D-cysteine desulfhydrase family pyridoxal phosphate-dependent enzyme
MGPNRFLDEQPRVMLGHWPTPLQPCDRLGEAIGGPRIWLKRDDCSGLAVGGNKTRKLEFLLGKALAEGCDGVVTFGALQSNHARQTAAACARLGLPCELILTRAVARDDEFYTRSGNVLLDRVLGATLHVVDDADAAFVRFGELYDRAERDGRRLFGIVPGGSDVTGVLGYVDATIELAEQVHAGSLDVQRIVVAASTAGTAAGLVLGVALTGLQTRVDAVCVYDTAETTGHELAALVARGAADLGIVEPDADSWLVHDDALGGGYGVPSDEGMAAIELLARTEGVLLDPVYTGKAFGRLLRDVRDGVLDEGRDVVFVHTGGSPGLFAYTDALST